MSTIKYTIIKSRQQYDEYCRILEHLVEKVDQSRNDIDEIELITFLIEKWDSENPVYKDLDPVELINFLMHEHHLKAKDLVNILDVSKSLVSDILNYKKGLSKDIIRSLSDHFKVSQEAFNRPYKLITPIQSSISKMKANKEPKALEIT